MILKKHNYDDIMMMVLVIMIMMMIITFGPAAGSPVCVAGIATCSSKAPISTSLSSKTDLSISLSSKIDVYFNITIITKDWPHLHMIDSEVDSLRYHHHHHHRRLTFISISLSSPKANWALLTAEERFWRHVVPRAFATQAMRSPKPIETVMQFHSILKKQICWW